MSETRPRTVNAALSREPRSPVSLRPYYFLHVFIEIKLRVEFMALNVKACCLIDSGVALLAVSGS
jgi:hypothetical protein